MATVPQRELRNNVGDVLRRAEAGERIVVTVDGRAVAELGPVTGSRAAATLESLRALGRADDAWQDDLRAMRDDEREHPADPWA